MGIFGECTPPTVSIFPTHKILREYILAEGSYQGITGSTKNRFIPHHFFKCPVLCHQTRPHKSVTDYIPCIGTFSPSYWGWYEREKSNIREYIVDDKGHIWRLANQSPVTTGSIWIMYIWPHPLTIMGQSFMSIWYVKINM